jgi:hypothetical protein
VSKTPVNPPPPPSKPPVVTRPPTKPPNRAYADDLFDLADSVFGHQTPARRDPMEAGSTFSAAVARAGGPAQATPARGECLSPGYAAALCGAACESAGVAASAGAISGRGGKVASGAPRPGFLLPPTLPVPSFRVGEQS